VLKIERRETRRDGALRRLNTDYYAPALKLIVGKEFKERDGRSSLNKFDRIYPTRP
jgi:hypothetical protein